MQLSDNTLEVLKNFSIINEALFFKEGNKLRTVSPAKTILAEATIEEHIPSDFGIHNLNQLLSILSLYPVAPTMTLHGHDLVIQGNQGRSKITYRCCDATMIKTPPDKNLAIPTIDLNFLLTEEDFHWIMKSSAVLASPNISIFVKNKKIYTGTHDSVDDSAHTDTLEIGTSSKEDMSFMFKTENWKMLPGTYEVTISSKGVALFIHQTRKLQYWVATEVKPRV